MKMLQRYYNSTLRYTTGFQMLLLATRLMRPVGLAQRVVVQFDGNYQVPRLSEPPWSLVKSSAIVF